MDNAKLTYGQSVQVLVKALASSKDPAIVDAIAVINSGRLRATTVNPVLAMLTAGGIGSTVHEDTLYNALHCGRRDTYWTIADAIKLAADKATRQWIAFDATTGLYTFMGIGATPPKDYKGYIPKLERK